LNDLIPEANMAKVQSKDDDERSGGGGSSGGGDGGDGSSDDRGSLGDFLSYLSGASPFPRTTSGSSPAPAFLPANVARVGNDNAVPPSDVEPIEPSAPPLSELAAEESTKTYSMPSVVFATPVPPPIAPRNQAMVSTTTAADDYVIATPMAAFSNRPLEPPEMAAFRDHHQPPSTGNEAWDATTPLSAPANQRGYEQRIREYKLGLVSLGLLAAVAIIAAVIAMGVDRPDTPSADLTSAPLPPLTIPTSAPVTYPSAPWIWEQQGQAIVGDADNDLFGSSVAMSADAKTLAVGAIGSNSYTGYVKVFYADDDGWSSMQLLGQSIFGEANDDYFGMSVGMSSDGKILAIGSPGYRWEDNRPGYVRVFHLVSDGLGSSWRQLGQDITGDADGDLFGWSVSLSSDGKTLAVGAIGNDGNGESSGCVRIYHLEDDVTHWEQIGQDIYGEAAGDNLGWSLSLSADGTTVVMGAPYNSGNGEDSGQVRVYQIDSAGSTWEQLGQNINGEADYDELGFSVDISPDGRTLVFGAPGYWDENDRPGYVRAYYLESNDLTSSWKQLGSDIYGEAVGDKFGSSVSLSGDGKTLAIGAIFNDENGESSGHVRVYRMDDSSTSWTQLGEDIDGKASYDNLGWSLSLSADGTTIAIGASWNWIWNVDNGPQTGLVRIFSVK
jgi:hypothetical protein